MSKVFCIETNSFHEQKNIYDYKITGDSIKKDGISCAVLKKHGDNKTYIKPWDQISFIRRPGENNISAKLKTYQVRQIVKECFTKTHDEVTFRMLAEKYGVTADTISDIANGRSWRHVTVPLIAQFKRGNMEVVDSCISASVDMKRKATKLNPSMAKFIIRDHYVNNISRQALAKKFLVSETTIRRVLTGKVWKDVTVPAIAEFSKWKNTK